MGLLPLLLLWLWVWLFGEGSGLTACGAEVEQDIGRQGGEGELLGLVDQDAGTTMCWIPCYLVLGIARLAWLIPAALRSPGMLVASVANTQVLEGQATQIAL